MTVNSSQRTRFGDLVDRGVHYLLLVRRRGIDFRDDAAEPGGGYGPQKLLLGGAVERQAMPARAPAKTAAALTTPANNRRSSDAEIIAFTKSINPGISADSRLQAPPEHGVSNRDQQLAAKKPSPARG